MRAQGIGYFPFDMSPCHAPVESDTKVHYLQRECLVRLVVVRRQGL
jgi:hypothetical protein